MGSIAASIIFNVLHPHKLQISETLHAAVETFAGIVAIAMAMLLLQLHRDGLREKGEYYLLSLGFFAMGILDTFHAVTVFGYGFLLLRSFASLLGGGCFALVWWGRLARHLPRRRGFPWPIICGCLATGFLILTYRDFFPLMMRDGRFTPTAVVLSLLAGALTLAAACYFLVEFLRYSRTESFLFTCMLLLLSLSSLEYPLSSAWSRDWWFWHVQRTVAFVVVFYYMWRTFLSALNEIKKANILLEKRIVERTSELTREVAERMRYGRERDQVIIELQEALAHIKMLTGLLPTCASCKKIRDAEGKWVQMETYIQNHSEARFTHGICPTCAKALYPDLYDKLFKTS